MKLSFIIFLFIVFIMFLISNFYIVGEVQNVIDGDTIKLKDGKVVKTAGNWNMLGYWIYKNPSK